MADLTTTPSCTIPSSTTTASTLSCPTSGPSEWLSLQDSQEQQVAPLAMIDFFFPGFSLYAGAVQRTLGIDLSMYISGLVLLSLLTWIWCWASSRFLKTIETYFMSSVDIRTDDDVYSIVMAWVATQKFATSARRFVANAESSSRAWHLRSYDCDSYDAEDSTDLLLDQAGGGNGGTPDGSVQGQFGRRALAYSPSFGTHYFWYRGRLLLFKRVAKDSTSSYPSSNEEITIFCYGRNPWILKRLLHEARALYNKRDETKTIIFRGMLRGGTGILEPEWQRCLARNSRPFSTVILNTKIKQEVIDDMTDYLNPATKHWYANRGIPYRRGYLLHGPPGTGKSSLSLALAGYFKMPIYIVSLSSVTASEEHLTTLFADLPSRCLVLLEDIDTAGLTHTREEDGSDIAETDDDETDDTDTESAADCSKTRHGPVAGGRPGGSPGGLSLSGLLNILDGVASQEGRVLIMTTNHVDKLDKALIRPGRVDMMVEFGRADEDMSAAIFRAIFARLEGDRDISHRDASALEEMSLQARRKRDEDMAQEQVKETARVEAMALEFAARIPAHEFSPAELQGHLLRHKRDPQAAINTADEFVAQTRRDHKDKELKEAEKKRKAEDMKKQKEEKAAKKTDKKNNRDKKCKEAKGKLCADLDSESSDAGAESENKIKKERKSKTKGTQTSNQPASSDSESSSVVEVEKPESSVGGDHTKAGE
ncbi:hypothetical protein PFICI_14167 [Pestalotiopsis fici W106-1]|uniref:Mitochondrial chaperone BCS1 n=1 Tax=Pestalotiopsis fici (strain W106-1 / CGMCC3.15140) TaxID=1229662 RepID=W3WNB3_PESFW|nr:uncharacterized protein PFICI_14167 [Pestalotiopsis fici W106-1]ETS74301.1 hypothetical protein PFICI_14167 [Pestalotiopsis fici W106-1]